MNVKQRLAALRAKCNSKFEIVSDAEFDWLVEYAEKLQKVSDAADAFAFSYCANMDELSSSIRIWLDPHFDRITGAIMEMESGD